jgi:hypothetical protein
VLRGDKDDAEDEQRTGQDTDISAVATMRRFCDAEIGNGRIPAGAALSRAAEMPPKTGLGRRKRRQ